MKNHRYPETAVKAVLCGLLYFCLAALPQPARAQGFVRPPGAGALRELFSPGLRAEIWTVNGEALWLDGIRLSTPPDFDALGPADPIARFSADTALPGGAQFFGRIQKIVLNEVTATFLPSNPQEMEYYRLGDLRSAVPPPPDWKHASGQIPPWHRAAAVPDLTGLPFLNHASYCWTHRAGDSEKDLGVYLFRQAFKLERPDTVARATLRLGTNVDLLEAAFNEYPLHLVGAQKPNLAEFEVTPLVQGGNNVVALKVRGRSGVLSANYGLAFHLEITRRKATGTAVPPRDPAAALLTSRGGDRVWGTPANLGENGITLATGYGEYSASWEDCASMLFPAGWRAPRPKPGLAERLLKKGASPAPVVGLNYYGLPVWMLPDRLQDCLLLSEGRVATARPVRAGDGKLYFEGAEEKQFSMPLEEVLGVFPPRPERETFRRPPHAVAVLHCLVATRTGETFGGLLRQISPETVRVETVGGQLLAIPSGNVATIQFPYHAATLSTAEAAKGPVALLPQAGDGEKFKETYDEDARRVQQAAFVIGAETKPLTPEQTVEGGNLHPDRTPVLVSVDPVGEYLYSWFGGGDAQAALVKYVEAGGVIVALSRGGAFRTPLENLGGGKTGPAKQARPTLAEVLGVRTIRPADPPAEGVTPFDQPPNEGGEFFFQRGSKLPEGLGALPRRIDLAPREQAPFYPMTAQQGGREQVIFTLTDARGHSYGPALTLLPHGRGWVVLVDHLLWESKVDERPFSVRALPVLLRWAMVNAGH